MSTMEQMPVLEKYQPYPQYKDSGLGWLGQIPNHWRSIQSRRLFSSRNVKALVGDRQLAATQKYGVIFQDIFMDLEGRRVVQVQKGAEILKHVEPGDFVISMRSFQGGIEYCCHEGCVSSAYVPLVPIKWVCSDYFKYLFKSASYIQALQSTSNLVRDGQALRFENFSQIDLPVVPVEEQRTIAAFLDYETARIDKLIAKQQRLIELLKEKRQAVISHAVTKGLNPDAPMKDSGVEWLGEVPKHWDVTRAKFLLKFITSGSRGWAEFYSDEGELFFRITNLTRDTIRPKLDSIQFVLPPAGAEGVRSRIRLGDLLVSITADLGSVCVADSSINGGYVSQHVALIRPNTRVTSSDWLGYFILSDSSKEQLLGSGYGGTKIQLSLSDMRDLWVAFPPNEEQNEISVFLLDRIEHFETLMNRAQRQISLQQERRTALISAAVTGKIDLRGWTQPKEVKA
ncbi:TPA: restriction endonuclease subunit S [Klebsiella pneumoniae]|nr:restriction endonuclease subunit S [Klebsiella pneumoniae]